jgi:ubiquinol-cytochrome c reductase cytochrome b subunit
MSARSRFADFLDARTGYRALLRHALDEPIPGGASWAFIFGSALVACIVLQAVTGCALMTVYAPSSTTAWASVAYITDSLSWGWLVRGMHHFGAHAMVVVLALHVAQVALYGAYRPPREVNWWLGLALLATTLGFALTGYLLPWDQKGYWATRVATNIAGSVPLVGRWIQQLVQGGAEYGTLTLTRFYTLHVALLPLVLVGLLVLHVALFRRHGITPSARADLSRIDRFYPPQLARDAVAAIALLLVVVFLAWRSHGAPLDAPADPSSEYPARPEWYFLPLFQLLKYFDGPLEPVGAVVIPGLAAAYLAILPFVDRASSSALAPRLRALSPLALGFCGLTALMVIAISTDASDTAFTKARVRAEGQSTLARRIAVGGVPPDGPLAMLRRDPQARGEELFVRHCATCHRLGDLGPTDAELAAPDLTGWGTRAWVLSVLDDPDAHDRFGSTPFRGGMLSLTRAPSDPARAKSFHSMAEGDRAAVAAFLEGEAAELADRGHDAEGAKLIAQRCTSCHLFRGETLDDDGAGPELAGWASRAWTIAQVANPGTNVTYRAGALSEDRKGHMPRFDSALAKEDLAILVDWVRAKAKATAR